MAKAANGNTNGFEETLWDSANKLRGSARCSPELGDLLLELQEGSLGAVYRALCTDPLTTSALSQNPVRCNSLSIFENACAIHDMVCSHA